MSRFLWRLGRSCATSPWRVLAAWTAVLVVALGLAATVGGERRDSYEVPGSSSQAATRLLQEHFPAMSGADAQVVVHDGTGATVDAALVIDVAARLSALRNVGGVTPQRSADGDTVRLAVQYTLPTTEFESVDAMAELEAAAAPAVERGLTVEYGGEVPGDAFEPSGTAEIVGVLVALVVLVVAFGSVVSAGLPLLVAFLGIGVGTAAFSLLALVMDVSADATGVAMMVGIGVGIDYSLLMVTRYAERLRAGRSVPDAAADATATAGMSVVFAGFTVLVSLFGMRLAGIPSFESFGATTGLLVLVIVASTVTAVPAVCGLAGSRILSRRERRGGPARGVGGGSTARWAATVARRPLPWALCGLVVLLLLAAPALGMRTWPLDAGSQPESSTVRKAYVLIAEEYGVGANAPLVVAVDTAQVPAADLGLLAGRLAGEDGVVAVSPPAVSADGGAAVLVVQPAYSPTDERGTALLQRLRGSVLPDGADVTGQTAVFVDTSERLAERLWLVVAFVVGVSFLLLVLVFRSVVVPVKAAILNLLSVGAAYGVLTALFQWGWGAALLDLPGPVPVSSFIPILLFTILFGLSMDYEVFLISRIRERWLATGDPTSSVVEGLAATGRVITSAALIMISVFLGFAVEGHVVMKMMGVGMATAIFVDATVVRMVLVPSAMVLLGRANWWLPAWLDRVLPHLDVEGSLLAVPSPRTGEPHAVPVDLVGVPR